MLQPTKTLALGQNDRQPLKTTGYCSTTIWLASQSFEPPAPSIQRILQLVVHLCPAGQRPQTPSNHRILQPGPQLTGVSNCRFAGPLVTAVSSGREQKIRIPGARANWLGQINLRLKTKNPVPRNRVFKRINLGNPDPTFVELHFPDTAVSTETVLSRLTPLIDSFHD